MIQRAYKSQSGFNLIELMIAIVIGLFISLMVVQYLATSSKIFKQQSADSNLEANGTFALSYMSQYVRQAGTHDPTGTDVPFYIGDCDGKDPEFADDPCTYNTDQPGNSDQMSVQMFPFNLLDCTGQAVEEEHRIANVFYVQDNSLHCRGYDVTDRSWLSDGESLIDGVEQLQVLYGVSNDDGQVDRYVNASSVADESGSDSEKLQAWDRVRSVKLAVLVSDGADSNTEFNDEERLFQLLDSPEVAFNDRVPRKVYSTTITINNKLP